ncbi:GIY-YIG nuclease family protein [uncultured Chryseobacterium sp.]|uniref:GIY-YIG nuclease family protein n=1 Tax=uncultured Chryseobacterium sp. TaxID=259322 RepID=UPI002604C1D3|nr:GIY-YIG nuclease family protein [uncultured Chryseobacterium sp.]
MKSYYVYIAKCSDNSYYTGITNDVERRINEHNDGLNAECYTYKRRPVTLVFYHEFGEVEQAILFEKQVKGWSRKKKEAIINNQWELLPELSMNKEKRLRQAQPDKPKE